MSESTTRGHPPEDQRGPVSSAAGNGLAVGLTCYWLSTLILVLGVLLGHDLLNPPHYSPHKPADELACFTAGDGQWYQRIAVSGYAYDVSRPSSVAFFPAYPLLARLAHLCLGGRIELSLLLVSHLCLAGCCILLYKYARQRYVGVQEDLPVSILLVFALLPTTCFFRFAYTESLFVLLTMAALYGMERRWPPLVLALVIGMATATRAVGVALLCPFIIHLWRQAPGPRAYLRSLVLYLPLGCWGILAYAGYLYAAFGAPLAFAQAQDNWRVRPLPSFHEKAVALMTGEPIRSVFDPSSPGYWDRREPETSPVFLLDLVNPLSFVLAVGLLALAAWRRWLSSYELALAAPLLLIPYVTRSYEMCMLGTARFVTAIFPLYLVLGRFLQAIPLYFRTLLLALCAFLLGVYAAMFASGHRIF